MLPFKTRTTVETLNTIDPDNLPEIVRAAKYGYKVIFTNSLYDHKEDILLFSGCDYRDGENSLRPERRKGRIQTKTGEYYQYAVAINSDEGRAVTGG